LIIINVPVSFSNPDILIPIYKGKILTYIINGENINLWDGMPSTNLPNVTLLIWDMLRKENGGIF
jgi:hypothetical protein